MKNEKIWYELDAFAKTYSSIISEGRTTCFRLSALFSENIDLEILQKVAISLEKKYPFYNSELKKGIFWNYLQQKKAHFMIEEEKTYPCTDIQKDNPLRIIYFNNKLSIEIAHFLTDGKGAALFFQDLIEEYLEKKYFGENLEKDKTDSLIDKTEKKKEVEIEKINKIINFGKKINKNEKDFENKKINGELTGGNLSIIVTTLGTDYEIDTKGKIFFIEEIEEEISRIDRMMTHLKYAGKFEDCNAVLLGNFAGCENTYGENYELIDFLKDFFKDYEKPVIYGLESGHEKPDLVTMPMGAKCTLKINEKINEIYFEK